MESRTALERVLRPLVWFYYLLVVGFAFGLSTVIIIRLAIRRQLKLVIRSKPLAKGTLWQSCHSYGNKFHIKCLYPFAVGCTIDSLLSKSVGEI